jgi:hypothetical protein
MSIIKDVKRITDIPGIEDYLTNVFTFICYDKGDQSVIYEFTVPGKKKITIDLSQPVYDFITGKILLIDIITDQTIEYFCWGERELGTTTSYQYRPFVPENEKDYL